MSDNVEFLKQHIPTVPDWPKPGILFYDINPLLAHPPAFKVALEEIGRLIPKDTESLVGLDARGFLFAAPLAESLSKKMVLIRKNGKLPGETTSVKYELEYGNAEFEVQKDRLKSGEKVVIIDDLLATGGTARAAASLITKSGAKVLKLIFLIELKDLKGREKLRAHPTEAIIKY